MKKITLYLVVLCGSFGFSQTPLEKIKSYMNENRLKLNLQSQDIADLVIVNDFNSESTGIFNYHVKQKYAGIEILSSDSNFWIKNGVVIHGGQEFISNLTQKINATQANLNVIAGFQKALESLKNSTPFASEIIQNTGNDYKLKNGNLNENPVFAKLNYFTTANNNLILAWEYEFYSQDYSHLWSIQVNALNGSILITRDLVISCNFGPNRKSHDHNLNSDLFNKTFFKTDATYAAFTPGTTQYRVIPFNFESPNHSSRQLVVNPEVAATASPKGWHDTNTLIGTTASLRYNITRGNNVWARNDFAGTNSTAAPNGTSPTGTGTWPSLTFDFPYPGNSAVASTYIDAANTNLFYMNNIMHDLWYQYGFNEQNKNFQANNYGRGGAQADFVIADSQDGSQAASPNLNNANFSAQTDGTSGRMQMYLWDIGPSFLTVMAPVDIAGGREARDNSFNPGNVSIPNSPNGIVSNLVLYDDAVGDTSDACDPAVNSAQLNGKIVVIRRGTCTFILKVKAAQNAGAIAVIIVNNVAGTIGMSGADATITIPAVSVTAQVGEALITRMQTTQVNVKLEKSSSFLNSDGDFDNGIVAHEYGHGISGRLSGSCLNSSEQQGEGWSDWFWLMMQIKPGDTRNGARGIGTFAQNEATDGGGIRRYRYSTNMAINPHTFGATNSMWFTNADGIDVVDVHSVGSVWAVTLWDLAWNYIDSYGYDPNIYNGTGGNNKVMRLVLDAIKLDGCSPSFISGRDALLAADLNTTGGANYCLIWSTFARRGLGANASSGTNVGVPGIQDQVEDFSIPAIGTTPATGSNCTLAINYFNNDEAVVLYPNPTHNELNIRINNYVGKLDIQIIDINGRIINNFINTDFNIEKLIDLNGLQNGVYIIKISADKLNFTKQFIKF